MGIERNHKTSQSITGSNSNFERSGVDNTLGRLGGDIALDL